jgi:hypothetical protein
MGSEFQQMMHSLLSSQGLPQSSEPIFFLHGPRPDQRVSWKKTASSRWLISQIFIRVLLNRVTLLEFLTNKRLDNQGFFQSFTYSRPCEIAARITRSFWSDIWRWGIYKIACQRNVTRISPAVENLSKNFRVSSGKSSVNLPTSDRSSINYILATEDGWRQGRCGREKKIRAHHCVIKKKKSRVLFSLFFWRPCRENADKWTSCQPRDLSTYLSPHGSLFFISAMDVRKIVKIQSC